MNSKSLNIKYEIYKIVIKELIKKYKNLKQKNKIKYI